MRPLSLAALLLWVFVAAPEAGRAQQESTYSFQVPVEVEDPHVDVGTAYVECSLYWWTYQPGASPVETARTPIPLDGSGSYSGPVTVEVTTPLLPNNWQCGLLLEHPYQSSNRVEPSASGSEWARPEPGTVFEALRSGLIRIVCRL